MFSNYLIGLREGLEAALVVGILVAYLVRSGNRSGLVWLWSGVAAAIVGCLASGALLTLTANELSNNAEAIFAGTLSLVAVTFVTWMVFWMKRAARSMKGELHGRLDRAMNVGGLALGIVGLAAVGREGLETALFLFTASQASGSGTNQVLGATLGLATATVLGYLVYQGALRLNLAAFFKWTGIGLIVVAAGVLAYGISDLQEAGVLPGHDTLAWDVSSAIPEGSWYGILLRGTVGFMPVTTSLAAIVWICYLAPALWLYLRGTGSNRGSKPTSTTWVGNVATFNPTVAAAAGTAVHAEVTGQ